MAGWWRGLVLVGLLAGLVPAGTTRAEEPARPAVYCHAELGMAAVPRTVCLRLTDYNGDVCRSLGFYAGEWALPEGYFARVIWQESRFNPNAISPAGAQGIAQFMPGTARLRGLRNAYNPAEALARSAQYLRFLADKFGNLGLAAAAYNSGEGRMARFLGGTGYMPIETEDYVQIVTGYPVTRWINDPPGDADYALEKETPFFDACMKLAETRTINRFEFEPGPYQPWGVQVAADFKPAVAQRIFERVQGRFAKVIGAEKMMIVARRNPSFGTRLRYQAQIGRETRAEAAQLCKALMAAGGVCLVMRN